MIFINIVRIFFILVGIAIALFILLLVRAVLKNYQFSFGFRRQGWRKDKKKKPKRPNRFRDYDF